MPNSVTYTSLQKKKHSFTLLEVILSLIIVSAAIAPLLSDVVFRVSLYGTMKRKLVGEMYCEERFFEELALLVSTNKYTFAQLNEGFDHSDRIHDDLLVSLSFHVLEQPDDSSTNQIRLGELAVSVSEQRSPKTALAKRSLIIAFQERPQ